VAEFFSRWIPEGGCIIDYGCGTGDFINAVTARRRIGVDLRSASRDTLDEGVEFSETEGVLMPGIGDVEADIVFCSNLLEHLPDRETVTRLLREFHRVLGPRSRLLLLGSNLQYTGPAYWNFFDHVLAFTHRTGAGALATADLEVETSIPRFLPYTTVGAKRTSLALVRLYLKVPLVWRVMGAQFFFVARRVREGS